MNEWIDEINRLKTEMIRYKDANIKLNKEANLNMQEICRLRGQVAQLRSNIIKLKGKNEREEL